MSGLGLNARCASALHASIASHFSTERRSIAKLDRRLTMPTKSGITHGNIASPEQNLQAEVEWTTEDFLAAEPYPLPEVTEKAVNDFMEQMTSSSAKGGSTLPGGLPGDTDDASGGGGDAGRLAGYPYPPPFNQHEVLVPYTTYPYCTIGK